LARNIIRSRTLKVTAAGHGHIVLNEEKNTKIETGIIESAYSEFYNAVSYLIVFYYVGNFHILR
jgi:hypothetical protein